MQAMLSKIAKGITVCYAEVFPNQDNEFFHLPYMGKLFLIADSYCMNPDCTCQEAVLNFVQVYPREGRDADSFMLRCKLNGRGYKIHDQGKFHRGEIKAIMMHFKADCNVQTLLTERFKEMREKVDEILS
jgi:hypothetical protein